MAGKKCTRRKNKTTITVRCPLSFEGTSIINHHNGRSCWWLPGLPGLLAAFVCTNAIANWFYFCARQLLWQCAVEKAWRIIIGFWYRCDGWLFVSGCVCARIINASHTNIRMPDFFFLLFSAVAPSIDWVCVPQLNRQHRAMVVAGWWLFRMNSCEQQRKKKIGPACSGAANLAEISKCMPHTRNATFWFLNWLSYAHQWFSARFGSEVYVCYSSIEQLEIPFGQPSIILILMFFYKLICVLTYRRIRITEALARTHIQAWTHCVPEHGHMVLRP